MSTSSAHYTHSALVTLSLLARRDRYKAFVERVMDGDSSDSLILQVGENIKYTCCAESLLTIEVWFGHRTIFRLKLK